MQKRILSLIFLGSIAFACQQKSDETIAPIENPASFAQVGTIDLGNSGASEISAYDPITKQLFVVNNQATPALNRIDVVSLASPAAPVLETSINLASIGAANSVAIKNGKLAVALEAPIKQDAGKVTFYDTKTLNLLQTVTVGALPDMITISPDGKYALTANEGEPNASYTTDPEGSVSIISMDDYSVNTVNFSAFASQENTLKNAGFRIFGLNATFVKDIEPEYITVSDDSKTAWVTLQENNGIAKIDLISKTITAIYPLGFKDHNNTNNALDPSDKDGGIAFVPYPLKGIYQPDAIAQYALNGIPYLITANEGDARDYTAFKEETTVGAAMLDATAFPNATDLKTEGKLGRLTITNTLGRNANGDYTELYAFGARSFSIWNGLNGNLVFDSGNDLERKVVDYIRSNYDDGRSDNKGVEPEGVTVGRVGNTIVAFIGLERADAVLLYDITNPNAPKFLQAIPTCDGPEGILFIPANESPTNKAMFITSCENDGVIRIYHTGNYLVKK